LHINILEARAVALALQRFDAIDNAITQPKIDNTSVIGAMRKGISNSADISIELSKIDETNAERGIVLLSPDHVASASNIADYWSRLPAKEADVPAHILARSRRCG